MKKNHWFKMIWLVWIALHRAEVHGRDSAWEPLAPRFGVGAIPSISMDGAGAAYALADSGKVLRSDDGGTTWRSLRSGKENLTGVHFQASGSGVVVGKGCIFHSGDGGANWNPAAINPSYELLAVHFATAQVGVAVGMYAPDYPLSRGIILRTEDGGLTWEVRSDTIGGDNGFKYLTSVHFPVPDTGYASGPGILAKSTDGGKSWKTQAIDPTLGNAVFFTDARIGHLAGNGEIMGLTTDGGDNWEAIGVPYGAIHSIHFPTARVGYAVGGSGILRKTTDGGETWELLPAWSQATLRTVRFLDADHGLAAGSGGLILRTQDGGKTWSSLPGTATAEDIVGLHFRDGRRGSLLAASGDALLTSDGGQLWTPAPRGAVRPMGTRGFSQVHFPQPEIGFALGDIVAKTVDGGSTWDSLGFNENGTGVHFVDGDTGYIVGGIKGFCQAGPSACTYDRSVYRKTTDGGKTWKSAIISSWPMLTVGCADVRNCYSAGYDGKLFRINRLFTDTTVDVIANRLDFRASGTMETLRAMDFPDPSTGYVVGSNGTILKSEDGGISWRLLASGGIASLRAVTFLDAQRGFVAGDSGTLLYTSDGGLSWALQPKLTDQSLTRMECPSQDTCFAAGGRGTILRLTGSLPSAIFRGMGRSIQAGRKWRLRWQINPISGPAADLLGRRTRAHGRASGIAILPEP